MRNLTREEARDRAAGLTVTSYDVAVDLTQGPSHFGSETVVRFEATGGLTLATAASVAASGVDFMSVGALTHSSPILDIALDLH